ncbi:MAG: aminotransferase class I/II-fold pyridoxal phosphate-dependent enzyme [Candidatus Nezhaarchaeota archaeon]|nr:aminotransferase class I/II-fold pyridoxal phosphate-dependent enzyme [Candidatus Nezhaarchaeota archaeon]MCX8142385.1 aminotransferase class I/II-fold pyridoxal phosphate-dependent enzyme [Candidatus Nezhaarchaeota archaeon]MDW8050642.1 aminotransferase class I/II-fold pyridoxal phosphate-dependent enzyme [Nitrososphaerota archaeon]
MVKIQSNRVSSIAYPITDLVTYARELERKGMDVIYLNIGDPAKFGFDPPPGSAEALYEAVKRGYNYYGPPRGDPELIERIVANESKRYGVKVASENVYVYLGASEAFTHIFAVLLDAGDEALIPAAYYPSYPGWVRLYDAIPVTYNLVEEDDWRPDIDDMRRKVTHRTKFILFCNPNNPTGALYSEKSIKEILDLAAEHALIVIEDAMYRGYVFEGEFKSAATLTKETCVITICDASKTYSIPGWRLGWIYITDPLGKYEEELRANLNKLSSARLCPSVPLQRAALTFFDAPEEYFNRRIEELRRRRDYVYKRIKETYGLNTVKPRASFFIFPKIERKGDIRDDKDFVLKLLCEKGVLLVYGSAFGPAGLDHIREVFLPPIEVLEKAHDRIEEFMREHVKD